MQPESLTDYLNRKKPKPAGRREPRWIEWTRANEKRGKDLTERNPERPDAA